MRKNVIKIGIVMCLVIMLIGLPIVPGETIETKPDFVVTVLSIAEEEFGPGDVVHFNVNIQNRGNEPSPYVHVGLYLYFDGGLIWSKSIPELDIGESEFYTEAHVWPSNTDPHTLRAVADPLDGVDELDEMNNEKTLVEEASYQSGT